MKYLFLITYLFGSLALYVVLASSLVGVVVTAGRRRFARLDPSAQSRIALAAAVAPAFLAAVFEGGAVYDIVLSGPADFCLNPHDSAPPSFILLLSVAILAGRILTCGIHSIVAVVRAVRLGRALPGEATEEFMGCLVLPVEEPQAYVLGILKPRVYVSRGLLEQASEDDLASVLAHEHAHAARRDPLRRLITSIGLVFHLPGIARLLDRLLTRTQEMAADADAARTVGDRVRVAESLVRFARLRRPGRATAVEFGSGDMEARVRELLDSRQRRSSGPSAAELIGCSAAFCLLALFAAHELHHIGQALLRLP